MVTNAIIFDLEEDVQTAMLTGAMHVVLLEKRISENEEVKTDAAVKDPAGVRSAEAKTLQRTSSYCHSRMIADVDVRYALSVDLPRHALLAMELASFAVVWCPMAPQSCPLVIQKRYLQEKQKNNHAGDVDDFCAGCTQRQKNDHADGVDDFCGGCRNPYC